MEFRGTHKKAITWYRKEAQLGDRAGKDALKRLGQSALVANIENQNATH